MTHRVALLLGVHAHQPVGNFPSVVDDAHERCYRPFLHTLYRYPEFRFAAHFSGWLLDELRARFPEDMTLLAAMVARGQVELFGAGDCEPVLAAIPARDRRGQLMALSNKLAAHFGQRPRGAWLTERVWESSVVPALADSGIRYVTVDDYHFLCTGREARELDGHYTTEEDGATLDLFPISEQLRYRLPFSPAQEAVAYLEQQARDGARAAVYFDDIEKFGIWPETYEWVYERGWLTQFIEGVLASPLIRTSTYADFHAAERTRGIVYLPTASYSEMNEWTLPAAAAATYAGLLARVKAGPDWERERPFVRGGIWRNFLTRYPEANWLHKRMLGLSARLAASSGREDPSLLGLLYAAQANDAYWHGLFGGLYLPHLRRAVWRNLVTLEAALDALEPRLEVRPADLDYDGATEYVLHNATVQVVIRDDGRAAAHELLSYPLGHNFGDTLRRHAEHYHQISGQISDQLSGEAHETAGSTEGGIASAHDRVAFKSLVVAEDLALDSHARAIALDHLLYPDGRRVVLNAWRLLAASATELRFEHALADASSPLEKCWRLTPAGCVIDYRTPLSAGVRLVSELNFAMPSCDGYGGRYVLADGSFPDGFGGRLELPEIAWLGLEDAELKGRLGISSRVPLQAKLAPHHTVSQSEAGLEKIIQAVCLALGWRAEFQTLSIETGPCAPWL